MNPYTMIPFGTFLEESEVLANKITIKKQYQKNEMEMNLYQFAKNQSVYLTPPKHIQGIKTYQILDGKLQPDHNNLTLGFGDLIVLHPEDPPFHIRVLEDAKLQVFSLFESAYEKTSKTMSSAIKIVEDIQRKDGYTRDHCSRAYDLGEKMGVYFGFEGKRLLNFVLAAGYHDLGKIFIEDHILNKPSKLSDEEFLIMKEHVLKSESIIRQNFNEEIFDIIAQHHERLDGSGYPKGLKGDRISEEGKMLAVIDSFDAMTTDRVYKKGQSQEEALKELEAFSGTRYEKKYIDGLRAVLRKEKKL